VEIILGAFVSPDGRWRLQAVREGNRSWYRILRDGVTYADGLVRREAERLLRLDAGLHLADLIEE
jgi:bifunctional non-homologous end joining protein LigD